MAMNLEKPKDDLQARAEGRTLNEGQQAIDGLNATQRGKKVEEFPGNGKKEITDLVTNLRNLKKNSRARLEMRNSPETAAILKRNEIPTEYIDKVLEDMDAIDHEEIIDNIKNGNITDVPEAVTSGLTTYQEGLQKISLDLRKRSQEAGPFDAPIIAQLDEEVRGVEGEVALLLEQVIKAGERIKETQNTI